MWVGILTDDIMLTLEAVAVVTAEAARLEGNMLGSRNAVCFTQTPQGLCIG